MTAKKKKIAHIFIIFFTLSFLTFTSCSKDNDLMSQKDIVELTSKYTDTLKEITACNNRIANLEEELSHTPPESAYIIEEMIDREKAKLEELEQQRADLETKLGLNK